MANFKAPLRMGRVFFLFSFFFFFFSPSLLYKRLLWVTFDEGRGFNRSCFLLQLDLRECFMMSIFLASHFFSLFLQSTSFESSLFFVFSIFKGFISSPFSSAPVRASVVVRGRAFLFVCFVSNSTLRFDLNAMASRVGGGFRSCIPSERT